jgi:hypothetical protein
MTLSFKPDLVAARALWASFWEGSNRRPFACLIVPKPNVAPVRRPSPYLMAFHEPEPLVGQTLEWAATHEFVQETMPWCEVSLGPDHLAALLGAELVAPGSDGETTWARPVVEDWDAFTIRFDERGYWWHRTVECIRAFRRGCDGRLLLAEPPLHSGLDGLAALRGVEGLMLDLALAPAKVERALRQIDDAADRARSALRRELGLEHCGYTNRYGMYSEAPMAVLQCDASCMIGPAAFSEIALPSLRREASAQCRSVYHLDGPGAVQHLEAVCGIEGIHSVQWKPTSAEEAASEESLSLYRRIRAAGKGIVVMARDRATIRAVASQLSCTAAHYNWFHDSLARSREEALELISELEAMSLRKRAGSAPR